MFRESDLAELRLFAGDYPVAKCFLFYGGRQTYTVEGIRVLPLASALPQLLRLLS
jgi:hypothetical protein